MNKLFKLMVFLVILMIGMNCNSGIQNPSSYVDLVKNQKLTVFSDDSNIGEVFNAVSKGKVVWEAMPMPANDSEYRYRNIHKTSVLITATWPAKYVKLGDNKYSELILAVQFAVKNDKSEFEIYRTSLDGEYQSNADMATTVRAIGAEYSGILYSMGAEKRNAEEKIEVEKRRIEEEKERVEEEKQKLELDQQIEFIKKLYFDDCGDTFENVFKIVSNELDKWEAIKINYDAPEYKDKKLYVVKVTFPRAYYYNYDLESWEWGEKIGGYATGNSISFFSGEDWTKIEGLNIKHGDIYEVSMYSSRIPNEREKINKIVDLIKKTYKDNKEGK
jgi:hypothetical protein